MTPASARPRVAVLLATYNGERWIGELLQSIAGQQGVDVQLFFADDGSTDRTVEIVTNFAAIRATPIAGPRMGTAARNFARLLASVDLASVDFVAFSDQDDVWLPEKLSRATGQMREGDASAYASNLIAFTESGERHLIDKAQPQRRHDFLFQSASAACTYVLRVDAARTLRDAIGDTYLGWSGNVSFDCVAYAATRSRGHRWVIDAAANILYRQHASNAFGANVGVSAARRRLDLMRSRWLRELVAVVRKYCAPDPELNRIADRVERGKFVDRAWLAARAGDFRRDRKGRLALRAFFFLGWY